MSRRQAVRGSIAIDIAITALLLVLGGVYALRGWNTGSLGWLLFGACGPTLMLALLASYKLGERGLQPPSRFALTVIATLATTLLVLGLALTWRAPALLLAAPVVGLAAFATVGLGLRMPSGRLDALEESLGGLLADSPLLVFVLYIAGPGAIALLRGARTMYAEGGAGPLLGVVGVMAGVIALIHGIRWLWSREGRFGGALRWTLRFLGFSFFFGGPFCGLTLLFYIVLGGPAERLPWLFAAQALVVLGGFALWARRSPRAPPVA